MSDPEVYLTRDEIEHPYANLVVMIEDKRRKAKEMKKTMFDRITASPEELAPLLVRINVHEFTGIFYTSVIVCGSWDDEADAIDATVAKLKEVEK